MRGTTIRNYEDGVIYMSHARRATMGHHSAHTAQEFYEETGTALRIEDGVVVGSIDEEEDYVF